MSWVLGLLLVQCAMGAFDSLWHHEILEKLTQKRSARYELRLHALREFLYAIVFIGLAWREWWGAWAYVLGAILLAEVVITLADFLEEDRTRVLPKLERIVHTILAINYGVWLGLLAPILLAWSRHDTELHPVHHGWISIALTVAGICVFLWSLRNSYAVLKHSRPNSWVRHPFKVGNRTGRTVLVTGATGFIGSALVRKLLARGDAVIALARDVDKAVDLFGPHVEIVTSLDHIASTRHIDAIVNLAGAPILALPWTEKRRAILLESRVTITRAIVQLCQRLNNTPRVLVSGSAIGYYGVRDEIECDESVAAQPQFQSELCSVWEACARAAASLGVRVVTLRTGLVLGKSGALPSLALPVRLFLGTVLGSGRQWVSWIHIDDVTRLIVFAIENPFLNGPMNAVAPRSVRHREFQRTLAKQLTRPLWLRVPAWLLRRAIGEMSQLLVDGQRVIPHKAGVHGFRFQYPTLQSALSAILSRSSVRVVPASAEVFYNGECPVCSVEMKHYAQITERTCSPLKFTDSTRAPQAFANYGLRSEHLEERLYVRESNGEIVSGMAAVLRVWEELPGIRLIAKVVALPGFFHAAVGLYDFVIAPSLAKWARRRRANATIRLGA